MRSKIFLFLLILFAFKANSQFHIGDSTVQVMLDVVQDKNCSEPMMLENSIYWTNYATNSDYFAFYNLRKRIFKLVVNPKARENFNVFIKVFETKYMRNNVGEWFAVENGKAYLIKTTYDPESVLKYVITYTKL